MPIMQFNEASLTCPTCGKLNTFKEGQAVVQCHACARYYYRPAPKDVIADA